MRERISGTPIGARLVALLLVPVVGLTFFAVRSGLSDREQAEAAQVLSYQAEQVALLGTLSSTIDDEIDGNSALADASAYGLDIGVVGLSLGVDIDRSFQLLQTRVDEAHDAIEAATTDGAEWADPAAVERALEGRELLASARSDDGPKLLTRAELNELEQQVAAPVRSALRAELDRFESSRAGLKLGPDLVATIRGSEASADLLEAARLERRALALLLLPTEQPDAINPHDRLVAASTRFDLAAAELDQQLPAELRLDFDAIKGAPSWRAIDDIRSQALTGGITPLADVADDQLGSASLGAAIYVQGFERTSALSELDQALTARVASEASALATSADDRFQLAVVVSLVLLFVTLIAGYTTVRSIVRPIRRLERRATRIGRGDLSAVEQSGPRDLAKVDVALDQLSAGLATVGAQTQALSEGRLDDGVLDGEVAGPLGAAIHGSVKRLRNLTASLEYQAKHDRLTRLPNRAALGELLDECLTGRLEARIPVVAIMLDLDGFKHANDTMGHPAGDEILIHVANRLRELAPRAFVCRLGGDEFMLVLIGEDDEQVGAQVAHHVLEILREPISVAAGTSWISASFGVIASSTPAWLSPSEVMRRADLALYEAKDLGAGEIVVFDQRLHDSVLLQNQIEGELRRALSGDELSLHVQPIIATSGGELVGFEGLLRWQPEGRPSISPGIFIPAAERSDLILQIDEWVLNRGCALLASWQEDHRLAGRSLSLNISGRHMASHELVRRVRSAISNHSIDPSLLTIEVTESELIPNIDRAEAVFAGLRALGVKLAIDDFGTGYASVAHLRRMRFDRLKIDGTFVSKLDDATERSIATLLVSLGRDLELDVVAEGIETYEQYEWAARAGCTHGQGYLFARPASPDSMDEMLQAVEDAIGPPTSTRPELQLG